MKVAKKEVKKKHNPKELLKKSYADSVQEEFEGKGVEFFEPGKSLNINSDYLTMPYDISEETSRSLGNLLNTFTQQKMYMRTLIGWAECMMEEKRREYAEVSIEPYKKVSSTKMSEKAKDILVNNHPEVLPVYNEWQDLKVKKNILELNLSSIEDAIFLISREISRRESDFNNEYRNYSVSRK